MQFAEHLVETGSAHICAQALGQPDNPAVLLICGAATSMDYWDDDFCRLLSDRGLFVIRYDLRDAGRSSNYPAGQPTYTGSDLVADAVAVLNALSVERVVVAGVSLGGGIAQSLALLHPEGGPDWP